jgi:hypothetical protein
MKQNPIIDKIKQQKQIDPNFNVLDSAILRTCFDPYCSEWKSSTLDQKVESLKYLREQGYKDTFTLAKSVLVHLQEKQNKNIDLEDITMALANLLDHMLEERKH